MRHAALGLIVAAAFLTAASPAPAASFVAHLKAPTHHPKAGRTWRITVTCTSRSGKPLRATAVYQFVYGGQVVSTQYPDPHDPKGGTKPYAFTGRYRDPIKWPARSTGVALKFRVVVSVKGQGKQNLDYSVRVRR